MKKRILSMILVIATVAAMIPAAILPVYAAEAYAG